MASLPIDIKLSKLILFGHVFGRLKEAIVLAAALSNKQIFARYFKSNFELFKAKYVYSRGLTCDFNCILSAYNYWTCLSRQSLPKYQQRLYCEKNGLNYNRMVELEDMVRKVEKSLAQFNLLSPSNDDLSDSYLHINPDGSVERKRIETDQEQEAIV